MKFALKKRYKNHPVGVEEIIDIFSKVFHKNTLDNFCSQ